MINIARWVLVGTAVSMLASCTFFSLATSTKLIPPTAEYVAHEIQQVGSAHANVNVKVKVNNKNSIGLRNVTISYETFVEGKRLIAGNDIQVDLKPAGDSDIVVPVRLVYRDIYAVLGVTANRVIADSPTIPVQVKLLFTGAPTLYNEHRSGSSYFSFAVPVEKTVDVPIPRQEIKNATKKAADKARKALKKLF